MRLLASTELTAGRQTAGISGSFTAEQALQQLLAGTGLTWRYSDEGTVLLEAAPPVEGAMMLDPVRVEGAVSASGEDRAYTTAGSSSYISQEKIERFRGTSVGDIFQGTPGVLVGEKRNGGGLDINIRGMQGQSRVPVVVDGARQETTIDRGYAGAASQSYVDPDLIGGIEITKGPSMSPDATGAVGGLVSMNTIGANDVVKDGKDWGLRLRLSAMGNSSEKPPNGTVAGYDPGGATYRTDCAVASLCQGQYALPDHFAPETGMDRPAFLDLRSWAGSFAAAKRFDGFDLVAAYARRHQGSYYAGTNGPTPWMDTSERVLPFYTEVTTALHGASRFRGGERIVNSDSDSDSILLKTSIYLSADQAWELSYLRYHATYSQLMPSQLIWGQQITQTPDSDINVSTYASRYHWNPSSLIDRLDLRFNVWYTHSKNINRSYADDTYETFDTSPEAEKYDRWGGDISNKMLFHTWGEHTLQYGFAVQLENIDTKSFDPKVTIPSGRIGDRQEYSAFLDWNWQIRPSLKLDAGVRYSDSHTDDHKRIVLPDINVCTTNPDGSGECQSQPPTPETNPYCVDADGDGVCDPIHYRTSNHGVAPIATLTWEPWLNGLQFYAQYAQAIRNPTLFEATHGWAAMPALDVPLRAEHAYDEEVGINLLRHGVLLDGDKLGVKFAYFRNHMRNYLTSSLSNTWELAGGPSIVLRNVDSVDLHGPELTLDYDGGWIYANLGGTYYDSIEVCQVGSYRRQACTNYGVAASFFNNMIPPKWHATATLGARLFRKRLEFGVRGTFMGQRTNAPPYDDETAIDLGKLVSRGITWHSYNLLDVYASYKPNDIVSVDFNIDNVTDEYYLDALDLGLVPAPGRTARLSLTLHI